MWGCEKLMHERAIAGVNRCRKEQAVTTWSPSSGSDAESTWWVCSLRLCWETRLALEAHANSKHGNAPYRYSYRAKNIRKKLLQMV